MADYGLREDGTRKGYGFFGPLSRPDGRVSTELSLGVDFDGKETLIPALVPTLTQEEIDYLLGGGRATDAIIQKAVDHAKKRMKQGKSPFADDYDTMGSYLPMMAEAVKFAENNPRNHGVLSIKTEHPSQVVQNSVQNNFQRWFAGEQPAPWIGMNEQHPSGDAFNPTRFVDFMHRRWAPIGAENDNGTNQYWDDNVRHYLKKKTTPEQWNMLRRLNFAQKGKSSETA